MRRTAGRVAGARRWGAIAAACLLAAGAPLVARAQTAAPAQPQTAAPAQPPRAPSPLPAPEATPAACAHEMFEASAFTICPFETDRQELRLVFDDGRGRALRTFAAFAHVLGAERHRLRFAMNAGMFDARGAPIGLFIADGRERRPLAVGAGGGNFYLQPNGVFSMDRDGALHVETTASYAARAPAPALASQSGPMLVIDGAVNPLFRADGASRYRRNGVGVISSRRAVFAISDEPVSFGRLARFFRDRLGCVNALYFDGAVSSLWAPREGRRDAGADLGPMIAAFDRPGAAADRHTGVTKAR